MVKQAKDKETPANVSMTGIRFSVKFSHIIMPFEINLLQNIVSNLGYTFEGQIPPRGIPGIEFVHSTRIAKKEDAEIEYNIEKQILGIKGNSSAIVDGFENVFSAIETAVRPLELKTLFYETIISGLCNGDNPLRMFSLSSNQFTKNKQYSEILGEEVSPFGMRLSPSNRPLDDTDWFEYRIEPFILQPTRLYNIGLVYRNRDFKKVKKVSQDFESISQRLLNTLEDN